MKKEEPRVLSKKFEKHLKKELKILNKISQKILKKEILKKIKTIEDINERLNALKHSLKSALDLEIYDLQKKIREMKKANKDVFFEEMKLSMIKNKIKLFTATYSKKDFNSAFSLIKELKKEVKDV